MEKVKIIYEDKDVLVINKPAGLVAHSDGRTKEFTLANWLLENYPEIKNVGESWETQNGEAREKKIIARPGIVHRLDRDTSGVMVVAKTEESFNSLKEQFKNRKVQKEYRVILGGTFGSGADAGTIDKPIGKSQSDFRKFSAQPGARGTMRDAITEYKVISSVGAGNSGYSYVSAAPKTGRTHQIRVHFKAVHHSVLGDKLYGVKKVADITTEVPRIMLHAHTISFKNLAGEAVEYTAELPEDFINVLNTIGLSTDKTQQQINTTNL